MTWNDIFSIKCIEQILISVCPGPSSEKLHEVIGTRLLRTRKVRDYVTEQHRKRCDRLINAMFTMMRKAKKGSTEKRIIRALFTKSFRPAILLQYCEQHGVGKSFCTSGSIRKQSKQDFDSLLEGNSILPQPTTRQCVRDDILLEAISFVLRKDQIATTSWGN